MFYEFLQYAYSWHSGSMIAILMVGVLSGVLSSLRRKKKSGIILLHVIVWLFMIYPMAVAPNYLRYHTGVVTCVTHSEYVMIRGICYKPVKAYVPYTTMEINHEVGEAVKDTTK